MKNRIIAMLLIVAMMVSLAPSAILEVFAAPAVQPIISVEDVWAASGSIVEVNVAISGNPGIYGATLTISWAEGLDLVDAESGDVFSGLSYQEPSRYVSSGTNFIWYGTRLREIQDGTVLKLTFEVAEKVEESAVLAINVTGDALTDAEDNTISASYVDGSVRIVNYLPGDTDENDTIDPRDLVALAKYISDNCTTDPNGFNVIINVSAADVNDDGNLDPRDLVLIAKYISDDCKTDPEGFNVILKPASPKCVHEMQEVAAKAATCTENGNRAYWSCPKCEKYFSNENGTTEITLENTVIDALGHQPGAEPTCTEAQTCTECGAVLKVANNHTEVTVPGYAATMEKEGLTDGIKCSACGKWVVEQTVIDKLLPKEHTITYFLAAGDYIDQGDAYLQKQVIKNPNPTTYRENEMVILQPMVSPGYTFDGWVDQHGTRWDVIPQGSTQELVLYAKWTQNVYTVTFDTPDVDVFTTYGGEELKNKAKYTIDTGLTLTNPTAYKYTFVGWSNDDGFIVNEIKPGTAENITLRANWTSDRNRATSYADYGDPIIIEDNERKQFLFVYNIGKIDNVPLYTYQRENGDKVMYQNTTVDFVDTTTLKTEFSREDAQNIAKTVSNATTRSSGWTLSEGWNDVMSESQEDSTKQVHSEERVDSKGNVVGNAYFISNSEGGSSYSSVESGSTSSNSARVTTEDSFGINTSYDKSTEKYCDAELSTGFKNETEVSAGVSAPVGIAKVEAGVKNTTTITADAKVSSGRKDNEAFHVDTNSSSFVGTDFSSSSSAYYNAVTSNSTNWNSTNSYEKSEQMSQETSVAEAIAKEIGSTTTYNISKSLNGAKENTESVSGVTSDETGYSNSVTVSEYMSKENVHVEAHKDDHVGNHRLVEAGIVHVYGVVGYDIATASYYTYTFNVLEDDTYAYWDYSLKDPSFKDCENGLVTFEIPYEVNEYIAGVTGQTEGLEIEVGNDGYGCVRGFEATEDFTGDVVVPQYLGVDNLDDTSDPVVVTSFDANAFRGNTEIRTVILPMYVTEIPDNAFEGCTNLETVIAYGITKIGKNAFKGCVNLGKFVNSKGETEYSAFMIDNMVTELGEGAFEGVNAVAVMAYDAAAADAAVNSGAKKITVDLTKLADDYTGTKEVTSATEYFKLIGGGKTFSGLKIKSDAAETFISNITLTENQDIPLELSSETVTLARVTVEDAPGLALCLTAEHTAVKLYRNVVLTSNSGNSVLSKNVTLSKANSGITGTLDFSGNYLVCGEIINTSMLKYHENVKTITEDEYAKYLGQVTVTFDTNDGTAIEPIAIGYDTKLTAPPAPKKEHYSFLGWFTDEALTIAFNFETPVTSDITLYAKWKLNEFTVTFETNGGSVSVTSMEVIYGEAYGDMPVPSRTGYTFNGWYTAATGGTKIEKATTVSAATNHTLYAQWTVNAYSASWNTGNGYTITVKRTSSPNANATIGNLKSDDTVYYGDVLSVTYTASTGYSLGNKGKTSITVTGNVTSSDIYTSASVNSYTVSWDTGTGYTIAVKRTSSPLKGASTGALKNGATVYYGDVLSVTYTASTGYSLSNQGSTSITVTGNVTKDQIKASASLNNYTYNIVYKSSNGTALGTSTATYKYGTTNTISAPAKSGYNTPDSQSVKWDSTSAKTITFTYTPSPVATTQWLTNGTWWKQNNYGITYDVKAEYRNRTANSVQVRIVWTQTISQSAFGYNQYFYCSLWHNGTNKGNTGNVKIASTSTWPYYSSNGPWHNSSVTAYSGWITVALDTTNATTVSVACDWWTESQSSKGSWGNKNISIPAY